MTHISQSNFSTIALSPMDSTVENAEPVLNLHFSACRKGFPGDKEAGDRSRSTHNCVAAHGREGSFVRLNVAGSHRMAHF